MKRGRRLTPALGFILAAFLWAGSVWAQSPGTSGGAPLIVGVDVAPPFAMKAPDGQWEGLSIDLWRAVADRLGLKYEFREMEFGPMLEAVAGGKLDAAVPGITITAPRESAMEFTHAYHASGLAIAVSKRSEHWHWFVVLRRLRTVEFLQLALTLLFVMAVSGFAIWFLERRHNHDQFGGSLARGLGSGFWWAAVTMASVGYGDKVPRTLGGRLVAIFCMYTGVVIVAAFTATTASWLTLSHFESAIRGPEDLGRFHVGTTAGTTSEEYLQSIHVVPRLYPSTEEGLRAVAGGEIDAYVFDEPILQYVAAKWDGDITVLPGNFEHQAYGFALPNGSPLLRPVDIALLEEISSPAWQAIKERYLGK